MVAVTVGDALRRADIAAVLTGGACASVHTAGRYTSVDADFVLTGEVLRRKLDLAMESVGFIRSGDRYVHPETEFYVEFPRGPLAIGSDHAIRPVEFVLGLRKCLTLSPTDSCRDRLAAFYHWNDRQSLDVAVQIALSNRLNLRLVRQWSEGEAKIDRYEEFLAELRRERRPRSGR